MDKKKTSLGLPLGKFTMIMGSTSPSRKTPQEKLDGLIPTGISPVHKFLDDTNREKKKSIQRKIKKIF